MSVREKVEALLRTRFENGFLGINIKRADRWEVAHFRVYVTPGTREDALQVVRNAGYTAVTEGTSVLKVCI